MIHPIPPGTSDVLPDEMRELRRLHLALIEVFEGFGYGEVATPAIEYDEVLARGDGRSAGSRLPLLRRERRPAGAARRNDGADRAPGRDPLRRRRGPGAALLPGQRLPRRPPAARADARVHPGRGRADRRPRRPQGTAEVVEVLEAALDAAGLDRAVIGLGDADLYRQLLAELGVEGEARDSILDRLATHDLVGLEAELAEVEGISDEQCATCLALSQLRGGREVLERGARARRRRGRAGDGADRRDLRGARSARRRRAGPDRPRPAPRPRLLQRRDPRGLRPGARPRARRRRPLRRPAQALRRRPSRRPASPSTWSASTSPRWRRSRGRGERAMSGLAGARPRQDRRAAEARGAARRAARRNPRRPRRGRHRHLRGARRVAGADLPRRGDHPGHDAPLRRPDLRRGGRRRRRDHRQGRPARAGRPGRLRAARPRLRPLPHGARRPQGRHPDWASPSAAWG